MAKEKYYINRDCVFSTMEKAVEHELSMRKKEHDDYNDSIYVCYIDEDMPVQVGIIDSYTGDVEIFNY